MIGFRVSGIALAVSAVFLAVGCSGGSANPSADSLISGMEAAVNAARSVHISGSIVMQGQDVKIDMSFSRSGDVSGRVSAGPVAYSIIVTRGKTYMAPNSAYLQQQGVPAKYCPMLCGKYANVGNSGLQGVSGSLSMSAIPGRALKTLNPKVMTVTGKRAVNGQTAWVLTASDGTGYIAAQGKPYLLRVIGTGTGAGGAGSSVDFTQWNAVTIPGPPPASQMVDTSKLPR
jgi:hypothetical protein